jgi:hypothetical protein
MSRRLVPWLVVAASVIGVLVGARVYASFAGG